MLKKISIKKICLGAILVALTYVCTMFISIPLSSSGYINLSDFFIVLTTLAIDPTVGLLVAIIAPALADLTLGYYIYIGFTVISKALEWFLCYLIFYKIKGNIKYLLAFIPGVAMALVYFIPDIIVLGKENYITCLINVLFNSLQGIVGMILGLALNKVFTKLDIKSRLV